MNDVEKLRFLETAMLSLFGRTVLLDATMCLVDVGLDSLDVVELQLYYEEISGKELLDVTPIVSVQDLLNIM